MLNNRICTGVTLQDNERLDTHHLFSLSPRLVVSAQALRIRLCPTCAESHPCSARTNTKYNFNTQTSLNYLKYVVCVWKNVNVHQLSTDGLPIQLVNSGIHFQFKAIDLFRSVK